MQLSYFGASFKHFSLSNHISALQNIIFSLGFHLGDHQRQTKHLPALTNPVCLLLCFCFLNNCKFLNLDLDWKIGFASFVIQKHTAESMAELPATPSSKSPLHPSCSIPSITTAHHGAVTSAGYSSECTQVQVHPVDTEFNSGFWRHTCTWQ